LKKSILYLCILANGFLFSQNGAIKGSVVDGANNPISFANVLLFEVDSLEAFKGVTTDEDGTFQVSNLEEKTFKIKVSFIGFSTVERTVEVVSVKNLGIIILEESSENLNEAVVSVKRPTVQKQAGRLVFNIENTSLSAGNTFDLLKKTPGVLVLGEKIQIKFASPIIYINDKRVYLSTSEVVSLLRNLDASVVKSIEVITNPSAKYDAEAGTVLNIITSKAISIGYKGSFNSAYEQAKFSKYSFGTSQFYKNDWLNFYGSYSFTPRKEFKEDDNYIRYFEPNGAVNSEWAGEFNRITRSKGHQVNIISDFTLNENQRLGVSANINLSPNKTYNNTGYTEIFDAQHQLDSTYTTLSALNIDTSNLSFSMDYEVDVDDKGSVVSATANYIYYNNEQLQDVSTDYFLPDGDFLRNNSFYTSGMQQSDILTGEANLSTHLFSGSFEVGIKYSNINTDSKLDFFDVLNTQLQFNSALSDDFNYEENIYAEHIDFEKQGEKWGLIAGLRGEYTFINAFSRNLGKLNTQKYFELFPSLSLQHTLNENNSISAAYSRRISRPRYQSLNPFRYFITENNYNGGNPNLVPAIDNKYILTYSYKNKWFFEGYYIQGRNKLSVLTFQDNENRILRNVESNLINDYNYSFDISYASSLFDWWYLSVYTSSFYMEQEFYSVESIPLIYTNDTFGFYGEMYSGITLSEKKSITSDVTLLYVSNYIEGSADYEGQFNLSIAFRKEFWKKQASISVGVDDIFNTNNFPVTNKYYNQDNSYFAKAESRLFRVGFMYNFGNARLRDNNRSTRTDESDRLKVD